MKSETPGQALCADVRARLSRGRRDKRHAMSDLEPAQLLTFSGQRHVTGQYGNLGCAHALTEFAALAAAERLPRPRCVCQAPLLRLKDSHRCPTQRAREL